MVRGKPLPDEGDLVVGKVKEVQNFGAVVELEEYPGKEGFLHIAEVSAGWVKRIRDHVREQARVVCKVLSVDKTRGQVELSLKRVNEHQRRETIQEWKNASKADRLLDQVAERLKKTGDECWTDFGAKLAEKFGTLYGAFENAAGDDTALSEEGFKGKWIEAFNAVAKENITVPFVNVKGYLKLTCSKPDGVKHLREALAAAAKSDFEDVEIQVKYLAAPLYLVKVRAPDYKVAEQQLDKATKAAIAAIQKRGGAGEFTKEMEAVVEE